jgi:hypothetical protein
MGRNPLNYQIACTERWKDKAIVRGKALKTQKQLVKECRASRENCRTKLENSDSKLARALARIGELEIELKKS